MYKKETELVNILAYGVVNENLTDDGKWWYTDSGKLQDIVFFVM